MIILFPLDILHEHNQPTLEAGMDDHNEPEAAGTFRSGGQTGIHTSPAQADDSLLLHADLMGDL